MTSLILWIPRLRKSNLYVILRDLHPVIGAYLSLFLFLIAFTGLFFAIGLVTGNLTMDVFRALPSELVENATPISVDAAIAKAQTNFWGGPQISVSLPDGDTGSYRILEFDMEQVTRASAYDINQYTGEVLQISRFSDCPEMLQARILAYAIHTGLIFGTPTKIIALLTCLGTILFTITGVWMWLKRRPKNKSGVPSGQLRGPTGTGLKLLIIFTGLIMPVPGISILLVIGIE